MTNKKLYEIKCSLINIESEVNLIHKGIKEIESRHNLSMKDSIITMISSIVLKVESLLIDMFVSFKVIK